MAKLRPDFSFVRDGRPLAAWLPELVAEDAPTRRSAGEALQAMMYGLPSVHSNLAEIEWGSSEAVSEQSGRFRDAVRERLDSPEFATQDFVRKLVLYRAALKEDWRRRMDLDQERDDAAGVYQDRLLRRLQDADGDPGRAEVARRYMRWICASWDRGLKRSRGVFAGAETMAAPGLMAAAVFHALDVALLSDRPGLRAMLADESLRHDAARALARIGPPAVDFASAFFEELDAEPSYFGEGARALGSIGRDDPGVIDGLLSRLRSGPVAVRSGAATALSHAGPPLAGRLEVALDLLLGATHTPELVHPSIPALASVGRDSEAALLRVLEVAEPRPPRWCSEENFPEYRHDAVMAERGTAIDSLRHFRRFAGRVVPALINAIDTFEEYDPDWDDGGDHGRVCAALHPFGPLAAPAVPRLVRFLEDWATRRGGERAWPRDVFRLLAAIGPPAVEALPVLEQLRASRMGDELASAELDPDDPLDRAILAIHRPGL